MNHLNDDYLSSSPSFDPKLLDWICDKKIKVLGVDTPSIEDFNNPYQPVNKFFNSNPNSLLLAPLKINHSFVSTNEYTLNCLPSFFSEVSGSLTRAILIEK
jgi:kynurenine formamidase